MGTETWSAPRQTRAFMTSCQNYCCEKRIFKIMSFIHPQKLLFYHRSQGYSPFWNHQQERKPKLQVLLQQRRARWPPAPSVSEGNLSVEVIPLVLHYFCYSFHSRVQYERGAGQADRRQLSGRPYRGRAVGGDVDEAQRATLPPPCWACTSRPTDPNKPTKEAGALEPLLASSTTALLPACLIS